MVSDSGQMQNPQGGTTVMIDGVSFVNANISKGTKTEFKGTPFEREVPLSQEQFDIISDRTSPTSANTVPDELSGPQMGSSKPSSAVQAVLDSLDPSKAISSDETTSISDIVSGAGMTPASTGGSSFSSKPSTPAPSSPANPANYNNKDGLPSKPSSPPPGHPEYNQGGNNDSSSGGK
jgi:hypothetical protein